MRKINKILLWVLAVLFSLFVLANVAISLFAKKIVVRQIEQNLKLPASLGSINIAPPLSINLNDLQVGGLFKAGRISLSPNVFALFAGKIVLSNMSLANAVITLERGVDGNLSLPKLEQEQKGRQEAAQAQKTRSRQSPIYITSLTVRNSQVVLIDRKIDPAGYRVIFGRINADISKVMLPPTSLKTNFRVTLDLLDPEEKRLGSLKFSGWLDMGPKDMDALLNIKDLDVTYFSPYYGNFISNKKLLSARLNLNSTFKAQNNDLDVLTNFKLSNLVYARQERSEGELPEIDLAKNTLDLFTDEHGNLALDFKIRTRLDKPDITVGQLKEAILSAAAKNLASQSPATLIQKVSDNIEQFKALGKSLKDIFKGE